LARKIWTGTPIFKSYAVLVPDKVRMNLMKDPNTAKKFFERRDCAMKRVQSQSAGGKPD
jgi:hypothetical protein